jgi:hypothetical protein
MSSERSPSKKRPAIARTQTFLAGRPSSTTRPVMTPVCTIVIVIGAVVWPSAIESGVPATFGVRRPYSPRRYPWRSAWTR